MFRSGTFTSQFNPNAAEFHPSTSYPRSNLQYTNSNVQQSTAPQQQSYINATLQQHYNNEPLHRYGYAAHHQQNWPHQVYGNNSDHMNNSTHNLEVYSPIKYVRRLTRDETTHRSARSLPASYLEAMSKLSELKAAGRLTDHEDEFFRHEFDARLPPDSVDERPRNLNVPIQKCYPNLSNRDEPQSRKRNYSMVSADRSDVCTESGVKEKPVPLVPTAEQTKAIECYLKPVMVHCVVVDKDESSRPKNLTIACDDGEVQVNRDLLRNASSFFHQMVGEFTNIVTIFQQEVHETNMMVELITKGRVAVLRGRLEKFMKILGHFKVAGVFHSVEIEIEQSFLEDSNVHKHEKQAAGNSLYTLQPYVYGTLAKVRCHSCYNLILETVFTEHYKEYHAKLNDSIHCCGEAFLTRYDYVQHNKMNCKENVNEIVYEPNISVIAKAEHIGVAVNPNVERPDANAHSTPIEEN